MHGDSTDRRSVVPILSHHDEAGDDERMNRAGNRATRGVNSHLDPFIATVRWVGLGSIVGVLAGLSSAAFLELLDWVTDTRVEQPWLLWLLPLAGFAIGLVYHFGAGRASAGNGLLLEEIHQQDRWIPRRMAPLVFGSTLVTHLFGGSAGREGTAIQMSGSLSDNLVSRTARFTGADRRLVLTAAVAGGFGAVFGVPIAGCLFALEVPTAGRVRHDAIVPALTAAVVGDRLVRWLDVEHTPFPVVGAVDLTFSLVAKIVLVGIAFGVVARVFAEALHICKRWFQRLVAWPPLRPLVGGVIVVALTYTVDTRDYLGLSLPLMIDSFGVGAAGLVGVATFAFAWKLVFTVITLGSGFQGGEVTPLFVIGATLGATVGHALDAPIPLFAAMGVVAVFAGATNTPIACTVMGVELFGAAIIVPLAIGCVLAYLLSGDGGIYSGQRVERPTAEPGRILRAE
jgi:H+/Cl- antiporter ClcA